MTRPGAILALLGFLAATFAVAGTSTIFTVQAIPIWYAALAKPPFNPPNQIFGPVWSLLYTLMAIAAWLIWKRPASPTRIRALIVFWVQLALNFAWSFLFFGEHRIGLALAEIVLLWLIILLTTWLFFQGNRVGGWLFVPYLAWVSFAAVLNFSLWRLNS
jgi:tryptophan-rich sensory protein